MQLLQKWPSYADKTTSNCIWIISVPRSSFLFAWKNDNDWKSRVHPSLRQTEAEDITQATYFVHQHTQGQVVAVLILNLSFCTSFNHLNIDIPLTFNWFVSSQGSEAESLALRSDLPRSSGVWQCELSGLTFPRETFEAFVVKCVSN